MRGVAVLGILLLNIVGFAMPQAAYSNPRAFGGWHGADLAVYLINFVLFDGKMRGLFSMLFGASLLLIADRAEASGRNPARVHFARVAWLLLFGLAHLWLVWSGDILSHYALVGMVAYACRRLAPLSAITLGVMLVAMQLVLWAQFPAMVAVSAQTPAHARDIAALVQAFGVPSPAAIAQEIARYRSDYAGLVSMRWHEDATLPLTSLTAYGCETLAYMLFGMAALRSGLLSGAWPRVRYRRWWLWSWAIALPGFLAIAWMLVAAQFSLPAVLLGVLVLTTPLRPAMILGWACLILLLARPGQPLSDRLAATGRMAFSNYLLTSLICTGLFYGPGLGWFGMLNRWQLYPIVALLWAAMLVWSPLWLSRFRFGPFEWLWRCLARARLEPMRR